MRPATIGATAPFPFSTSASISARSSRRSSAARSAKTYGWHYGFAAAGVGMTLGLAIYLAATPTLPRDAFVRRDTSQQPLDRADWRAIGALLVLFIPVSLFWATYEQQGNTIALWADGFTDRHVVRRGNPGHLVPGVQSVHDLRLHAVHRRALAPAGRNASPRPWSSWRSAVCSTPRRGCSWRAAAQRNGRRPGELALAVRLFVVITVGELYLSPTSLSLVTKVAPAGVLSMMMGVWLATSFVGGFLAGYLGTFWSAMSKPGFFLMLAVISAAAGLFDRAGEPAAARRAARLVIFFSAENRSPVFGIMRAAARHIARPANGRRIPTRSGNRDRPAAACGRTADLVREAMHDLRHPPGEALRLPHPAQALVPNSSPAIRSCRFL